MNIIEQLMVEHAALRLHFRYARETNPDKIYEMEDFIRNCHAKIEDEVVFPKLKVSLDSPSNAKLTQVILRLEADHKLIDTMGDQITQNSSGRRRNTEKKNPTLHEHSRIT